MATLDRQLVFVARHPLQASDIYIGPSGTEFGSCALVLGYLYGAAIEHLCPCWLDLPKHSEAWGELNQRLCGYARDGVNFAQEAIDRDLFENKDLYELSPYSMIDIWAIGVLISNNPKDMKFALRVMRTYFKKGFPGAKNAAAEWDRKTSEAKRACIKNAINSLASNPVPKVMSPKFDASLGPAYLADVTGHTMGKIISFIDDIDEELDTWLYLMIGKQSGFIEMTRKWKAEMEHDFPDEINERVLANLNGLMPSPIACMYCMEQFRPMLAHLYILAEIDSDDEITVENGEVVEDELSITAENVVLPLIGWNRDVTTRLSALIAEKHQKEKEFEDQLTKMKENITSNKIAEAQAEQIKRLTAQLAAAQKEAKAAKAETQRLSEALTKSAGYTQKLEGCLEESEAQRKELDAQLADLMDNRDELIQAEVEEQVSPSGVRERIGEDAYQLLCSKRVAVVGGHANTHATLRELFPNWQYYPPEIVLRDTVWAVDAVICITTYTSHKSYHQAKDRAKNRGIDFISVPHNGPAAICQQLAEYFAKKESVA